MEPKTLPILFSAAMMQAILRGTKTMTRRIVSAKHLPYLDELLANYLTGNWEQRPRPFKAGDLLWTRESFYALGHWEPVPGARTKTGRQKWRFVQHGNDIRFDAPPEFRKGRHHKDPETVAWHKRLGRFQPRKYSRLLLEVTNVQLEHLQDISEADAQAEGAPCERYEHAGSGVAPKYRYGFARLWKQINGKDSWDANPYVWVISFKVKNKTLQKGSTWQTKKT